MAAFIMQLTNSVVSISCNSVLAHVGGDLYVSIMTIINSARQMLETPLLAVTEGTSPIMSYNYGAGKYKEVKDAIRIMVLLGLGYAGSIWILLCLFPQFFIGIFSSDKSILETALPAFHLYFSTFIFMVFQHSGQMVFKSLGKKNYAIFFSLLRKAFIVVPLTYLLSQKVMVPLVGFAMLAMTVQVLFRKEPELPDFVMSALPLLTVALPGLALVALSMIDPYAWHVESNPMPLHAVEVVILTVTFAVPLMGDMMALFVGKAFGKRKFCPAVSPKKTIAGSIGGLGGSILAAVVVYLLSTKLCNEETLKLLPVWWQYLLLGLVGGFAGQMGDLFASLVKRHCGLKDFSNIFPGHGGMLDRLDSTLFMAVLMYCYRLFFMTV